MYTTAADMARFLQFLTESGRARGPQRETDAEVARLKIAGLSELGPSQDEEDGSSYSDVLSAWWMRLAAAPVSSARWPVRIRDAVGVPAAPSKHVTRTAEEEWEWGWECECECEW